MNESPRQDGFVNGVVKKIRKRHLGMIHVHIYAFYAGEGIKYSFRPTEIRFPSKCLIRVIIYPKDLQVNLKHYFYSHYFCLKQRQRPFVTHWTHKLFQIRTVMSQPTLKPGLQTYLETLIGDSQLSR